jgi:SAM-dependent methyltransferase
MTLELPRYCPLCGAKAAGVSFPYATRFNNVLFKYLRCGGCQSVFVDPIPDHQTSVRMYAKYDYHDCHYKGIEGEAYTKSARRLKQYLPAGSLVLDYGCGTGAFLKALNAEGFVPFGVDFDQAAARFAGENTGCSTLTVDEFEELSERLKFDAIHLGDVLEHLPSPESTLRELLSRLKSGGVLFVEGPIEINPSPVYWSTYIYGVIKRIIRPHFIGDHKPTHLYFTCAKQQMAFFTRVSPSLRLQHWQVYETGWPYDSGGFIKRVIASFANRLGGKQLFGSTFGNRFSGIFVCHRTVGELEQ